MEARIRKKRLANEVLERGAELHRQKACDIAQAHGELEIESAEAEVQLELNMQACATQRCGNEQLQREAELCRQEASEVATASGDEWQGVDSALAMAERQRRRAYNDRV